jgi:flagellar M-ring protein FliF
MDSQANSLINPDARMGLAGAQPGAATLQGAAGAGAGTPELGGFAQRLGSLSQMRSNPRAPLIFAVAVLIAVVAALVLWTRSPDYRVLYSNLSDQDGGQIIAALQQANVPYKFSEGGGAIMIPSDQVNEMRLRLASQGLPKSGSVGMELMDNEKFGISQFAEQINYQRALEGELERTIQSVSVVRQARVHLAIPKPTVFVREREQPTASVLVNLYPGRTLDEGQVSAITHMVASSVPQLPVKNVTIVDQDGNLLTQPSSVNGLDASQLKYVQQVEHNTQRRIDAILAPLFGAGNAHSQVSADIDFSQAEQTAETYGPNGNPQAAAIRSQQTSSDMQLSQGGASGVPGALSNTPPQPASAPVTVANGAAAASSVTTTPISERKDATTNYELDKHVSHVEQSMGGVKRLSAAVVINYQRVVDAKGHATMKPLTPELRAQVEQLVKDAMGYDAKRGDSVNVVNSEFSTEVDPLANLPWWRQPDVIALAMQAAKWIGIGLVALVLYLALVKPAMRRAFPPPAEKGEGEGGVSDPLAGPDEPVLLDGLSSATPVGAALEGGLDMEQNLLSFENEKHKFERNLDYARTIARQDPKIVATVVKSWVSDER